MKKLITLSLSLLLGSLVSASTPSAPQRPSFNEDLHCLNEEFQGLSALEQLLEENNSTYTELSALENPLLRHVANDQQDISHSLLAASAPMDPALKAVLIVFGILAVLAIGCCAIYFIAVGSWWWY